MHTKLQIGPIGACFCAVLLTCSAARGEEQSGRYTMSPTEGGVIRLDKETGAMSFCAGKDNDWSCKPMPDAQKDLEGRINQLERENKALKEENSRLAAEGGTGGTMPHAGEPPAPPGDLPIPREDDVDKLFDYVEGMMKKFKERIKRLEKEAQKGEPL